MHMFLPADWGINSPVPSKPSSCTGACRVCFSHDLVRRAAILRSGLAGAPHRPLPWPVWGRTPHITLAVPWTIRCAPPRELLVPVCCAPIAGSREAEKDEDVSCRMQRTDWHRGWTDCTGNTRSTRNFPHCYLDPTYATLYLAK